LEAYKELVPDFAEEFKRQGSIIGIRVKEFGIPYPEGINITKEKL